MFDGETRQRGSVEVDVLAGHGVSVRPHLPGGADAGSRGGGVATSSATAPTPPPELLDVWCIPAPSLPPPQPTPQPPPPTELTLLSTWGGFDVFGWMWEGTDSFALNRKRLIKVK